MKPVRTRFAPSPTGFLHVGGARTALYSWLFTRKMHGKFILRIEDTDVERSTQASVQAILDAMEWLELDYDEGPYYQTHHMERYSEVIQLLLESGDAYRCDCSKERLETLRAEQMAKKEKPRYDGHCRDRQLSADVPHVIRFRNPLEGEVVFEDIIRGELTFQNAELDDLIIARTDGTPTYNFTVVVDDWDMKITHVIRGDDHINNTPRQINILNALGAHIPTYAHVSMILGDDGARLSKRHGAVSVMQYRDEGFLPEALLNYLVRLGWSHGDQEIFSRAEMVKLFDVPHINRAPAAFNTEKLLWLNQHYLKERDPETLVDAFGEQLQALGIKTTHGPALVEVIVALRERAKTLKEMAEKSRYFFEEPEYDATATKQYLGAAEAPALAAIKAGLSDLTVWNAEAIHEVLKSAADILGLKLGKVAQPVRVAVTGNTMSPSLDVTLHLIGRERSVQRLTHALTLCTTS